jgi:hypothetical protein
MGALPRKLVGVAPRSEWAKRPRLFSALEEAFPAVFEPRHPGELRGLDALIEFGNTSSAEGGGLPSLALGTLNGCATVPGIVCLSQSVQLDKRLRGRALREVDVGPSLEAVREGKGDVVATSERSALWVRAEAANGADRAALAPAELQDAESLRDALVPGRWLALLPLVHFLREICAELLWTPPPLRAAFIFDDPNLHWPSYGYLRFAELARHAEAQGYCVSFATIPLDGWFVHAGAARLFREHRVLSLLAHGNDHVRGELTRPRQQGEAAAMLARSHRRLTKLVRRSGVEVSRLMVAPFGLCSPEMMRMLLRAGFEGLCHSWPTPRAPDRLLAGWEVADLVEGGFPVFPRLLLTNSLDDLVWRAYLDQPLILYGHHGDVLGGLDILSERASEVARFGDIQWMSPARIARTSFLTKREGATLRVRPYSRQIEIDVPAGVERLRVELPRSHTEPEREALLLTAESRRSSSRFETGVAALLDTDGAARVELRLVRDDAIDLASTPPGRTRLIPLLRRFGTEGRDRLRPLVRR